MSLNFADSEENLNDIQQCDCNECRKHFDELNRQNTEENKETTEDEKFKNENRDFIKQRYLHYKYLLGNYCKNETWLLKKFCIRCLKSCYLHLEGCMFGFLTGALNGIALAGKWGGNGGWGVSGIMMGLNILILPWVTGTCGALLGLQCNKYEIMEIAKDYRYACISTNSDQTIQSNTVQFPEYKIPSHITKGRRTFTPTVVNSFYNPHGNQSTGNAIN